MTTRAEVNQFMLKMLNEQIERAHAQLPTDVAMLHSPARLNPSELRALAANVTELQVLVAQRDALHDLIKSYKGCNE